MRYYIVPDRAGHDITDEGKPLRDTDLVARLNEQDEAITTLRAQLAAAQAQLDTARRVPLGRYAFYHRHLAMGYVRKRDPELANWASTEAGHQIDQEGGKTFEDVVAGLEKERDEAIQALGDIVLNPRAAAILDRYAPAALVNARKIVDRVPEMPRGEGNADG